MEIDSLPSRFIGSVRKFDDTVAFWDYANTTLRTTKEFLRLNPKASIIGEDLTKFGEFSGFNARAYSVAATTEVVLALGLGRVAFESRFSLGTRFAAGLGAVGLVGQAVRHGLSAVEAYCDAGVAYSQPSLCSADLSEHSQHQKPLHIQR